jgi:hypothetical protein
VDMASSDGGGHGGVDGGGGGHAGPDRTSSPFTPGRAGGHHHHHRHHRNSLTPGAPAYLQVSVYPPCVVSVDLLPVFDSVWSLQSVSTHPAWSVLTYCLCLTVFGHCSQCLPTLRGQC